MTINGPAPVLLACFMNAAIDQQVEKYLRASGGWQAVEARIAALFQDLPRPRYRARAIAARGPKGMTAWASGFWE